MKKVNFLLKSFLFFSFVSLVTLQSKNARAATITLQNGTATYSQPLGGAPLSPDEAVDGSFNDSDPDGGFNGWAIAQPPFGQDAVSEIAVWETETDVAAGQLDIGMHFLHFNPGHLLGRFRFSVTTDDRSTFADGLDNNGDVTANWSVLENPFISGPAGMTFTTLADNSILAGGTTAAQGVYNLTYSTNLNNITGLRLEVLEDPSLPLNGPGLFPNNGNFVLTEMTLDSTPAPNPVPEPMGILGMLVAASFGAVIKNKRRDEVRD
ncbi:MAG: PEP-CTERM sorting domain-containing protein [Cyanobacteria bacterium SBLK]|nr:PEP-CTERM sorting domain-containing protein [Cyanobacteria bacterium SBLK]